MDYWLIGNKQKTLFIANKGGWRSYYFDVKEKTWKDGGCKVADVIHGFDSSEPADSPYAFGNFDIDFDVISKEEAESFIGESIDEEKFKKLLGE